MPLTWLLSDINVRIISAWGGLARNIYSFGGNYDFLWLCSTCSFCPVDQLDFCSLYLLLSGQHYLWCSPFIFRIISLVASIQFHFFAFLDLWSVPSRNMSYPASPIIWSQTRLLPHCFHRHLMGSRSQTWTPWHGLVSDTYSVLSENYVFGPMFHFQRERNDAWGRIRRITYVNVLLINIC